MPSGSTVAEMDSADHAPSAMSRVRNVAVIDIGKTHAKVALVDLLAMREIGVRETPNAVLRDGPFPHHDTQAIWGFLIDALGRFGAQNEVDAITATTHGAAAMLLDAAGDAVLPLLDYEHDGPDDLADEYDALRPSFAESGSPRLAHGFNLGAQLHWLLSTRPELRARIGHVVTYPQYWVGRLTGTWCTEVASLGCHTDLWLPRERRFSELVEKLGLDGRFPPMRKAWDLVGTLLPDVARATGLPQCTPVYCGIHDSNASLYPHLMGRSAPFSVISTGTWVITMAVGGTPRPLDPARDTLMNVSAFGDPVPSARFMGGREFEILTSGAPVTPTRAEITAVLNQCVTLSPAVVSTSGPFQGRRSSWSVPVHELTDGERTAVASLYLAMMALTCLELTGAEGPIVTEGPFAGNTLFLDLVAAASGRQVMSSTGSATGTSIGAALLAAEGARPLLNHSPHPSPEGAYREDLVRYVERWHVRANS